MDSTENIFLIQKDQLNRRHLQIYGIFNTIPCTTWCYSTHKSCPMPWTHIAWENEHEVQQMSRKRLPAKYKTVNIKWADSCVSRLSAFHHVNSAIMGQCIQSFSHLFFGLRCIWMGGWSRVWKTSRSTLHFCLSQPNSIKSSVMLYHILQHETRLDVITDLLNNVLKAPTSKSSFSFPLVSK